MKFTHGYLDPSYRKWQGYILFSQSAEMYSAHDLRFGIVKVLKYPEPGSRALHRKEWQGFSFNIRFIYGDYAPGIWWHSPKRIRRLFLIPIIWFRKGI